MLKKMFAILVYTHCNNLINILMKNAIYKKKKRLFELVFNICFFETEVENKHFFNYSSMLALTGRTTAKRYIIIESFYGLKGRTRRNKPS